MGSSTAVTQSSKFGSEDIFFTQRVYIYKQCLGYVLQIMQWSKVTIVVLLPTLCPLTCQPVQDAGVTGGSMLLSCDPVGISARSESHSVHLHLLSFTFLSST